MIKNARYKSDFLYEINGLIDGEIRGYAKC